MPSKLRSGKARVSFFAFQDMITTVTGVLLLITLMLTLYLNAQPEQPAPEDNVRDKLNEAREQLNSRLAELRRQQLEQLSLTNRIFVVAAPDSSGKQPVLVVLSATNGIYTRLGATNSTEFPNGGFDDVLKELDPAAQRIVFYIQPSGIIHFDACRQLALDRSFSIGYDAAEEGRQYTLRPR
jgi:hypothetical protein